jgi:hypothetical protein
MHIIIGLKILRGQRRCFPATSHIGNPPVQILFGRKRAHRRAGDTAKAYLDRSAFAAAIDLELHRCFAGSAWATLPPMVPRLRT